MITRIFLLILLSSVALSPVLADDLYDADNDSGFYAGIGLARSDVDANDFDESGNEVGLRLGYMFTDNIGVDLTSASLGTTSAEGFDIDVGVVAIGVIGSIPVGEAADIYGKMGAARIVLEASKDGVSEIDSSDTELFWGVGGEIDLGVTNIFLEYNRFDAEQADVNTLMTGVKFEF